jgi:hypothetical protein
VDPEPDLGRAVVELGARRSGRDGAIEGPGAAAPAAAARRGGGGGRDGVAARALDGGAELVGAVAERRMRGPRRVHGGRPGGGGSAARIWISPLALRLGGWEGGSGRSTRTRETRWEGGGEAHGRSVGWAGDGESSWKLGEILVRPQEFFLRGEGVGENAVTYAVRGVHAAVFSLHRLTAKQRLR